MGLTEEILFFLSNSPGNYGRLRSRMLGNLYIEDQLNEQTRKRKLKSGQERTLRVTLSKLKKNGLIKNDGHLWQLTPAGLIKFKNQYLYKKHSMVVPPVKSDRKIIIAFDIPEDKRKGRNWLRVELISLNFKMLQKSVWLGPAPLPKEFLDHLKIMDVLPYLKFFEVKETDIV
ncbi:MAG: hypothetical protein NTV48_02590 [Candidatus Vogelbacteria bacterium]|nr:hypothetical protein [Candidatus Vogelbacteria bacterium]